MTSAGHAIARVATGLLLAVAACDSEPAPPLAHADDRNDLASMATARVTIGPHAFEVWVAATERERALGLMHVAASQLAPTSDGAARGMLFVYPVEQALSFWMKDTPTALDIAFMDADGTLVTLSAMAPLDTSRHPSVKPAQYALEVLAGTYAALGVAVGDRASLP
jgi:uncharacterized membrane protein (UPF0127 family)